MEKDTMKEGYDGEKLVANILREKYMALHLYNDNAEYDHWFAVVGKIEVKTQLKAADIGGYSIEIGDKNPKYYTGEESIYEWRGERYYPTGLALSQSKYYIFTDLKDAYMISTSKLRQMTELVPERIKFGGGYKASLQWQIKINELKKYGKLIYTEDKA
jgi:hypothetical protein